MHLEGKVAVITGAGSGIGRALAETCARRGMDVVVADIDAEAAETVASGIERSGRRALATAVDVADPDEVDRLADEAYRAFASVHLVCNNAGVLLVRPFEETTLDDWHWLLSVNLFGVINGLRSFLPGLAAQGEPAHVMNTASMSALVTGGAPGNAAYAASKFAVAGLTEALRPEVAPLGIGLSLLCPSSVETRLKDAERNRQVRFGPSTGIVPGTAPADADIIEPAIVAEMAIRGVERDRETVVTHPSRRHDVEARCRRLLEAFGAAAIDRADLST